MACRPLPVESTPATVAEILVDALTNLLVGRGIQHAAAVPIARRHVDQVLQRLGGGWVYLPKGLDFTKEARAARNATILEMHRSGLGKEAILSAFRIKKTVYYAIIGKKNK